MKTRTSVSGFTLVELLVVLAILGLLAGLTLPVPHVLAATLVYGWFVLSPLEYKAVGKHALAGSFFVSNFAFWQEAGYFDTESYSKPLLHLWSLAVEEQFYLFWPVALLLGPRWLGRRWMPWLVAAALLHSAVVTERRGALAGWIPSLSGGAEPGDRGLGSTRSRAENPMKSPMFDT